MGHDVPFFLGNYAMEADISKLMKEEEAFIAKYTENQRLLASEKTGHSKALAVKDEIRRDRERKVIYP